MLKNLYLTLAEQKIFSKLPEKVREGWSVVPELRTYKDSSDKTMMRLQFLRLHDPELRVHMQALKGCTPQQAVEKISTMDLRRADQPDLAELVFALGPAALSRLIELFLSTKTDASVEQAAALSVIRNSLLVSLQS